MPTLTIDGAIRAMLAQARNERVTEEAADLWLYGLADDRDPRDIARDVAALGPVLCADPRCALTNEHRAH